MTLAEFIERHNITMKCVRLLGRDDGSSWDRDASHWQVKIMMTRVARSFLTSYSMGSAHKGSPKLPAVLECLQSDCQAARETFAGFCDEFGLDVDSLKARDTYGACVGVSTGIHRAFGPDVFREFLECDPE